MTKSISRGVDPLKFEVHITFADSDFARVFGNTSDAKLTALYGTLMGPSTVNLTEAELADAVGAFARANEKALEAEAKVLAQGGKV